MSCAGLSWWGKKGNLKTFDELLNINKGKIKGMQNSEALVVIGNGFDLACGLKTLYTNFYDYMLHPEYFHLMCSEQPFECSINGDKKIKENIDNEAWNDINLFLYLIYSCDSLANKQSWTDFESALKIYLERIFDNKSSEELKYTQKFMHGKYGIDKLTPFEDIKYKILDELKDFEECFRDYLNYEVLNGKALREDYNKKAEVLLKNIVGYSLRKFGDVLYGNPARQNLMLELGGTPTSKLPFDPNTTLVEELNFDCYLLTFNYTRPQEIKADDSKISYHSINNIHGERDKTSEIIFGIDALNIDKELDIFTKSYRRLSLPNKQFVLKKVDKIFFYGHGLGEADYSYFMATFDYYHLYESEIKLVFCYSDYKNNPAKCREEETKRVVNLIDNYGKSLSDIHGKNLMYKLQIEGRIEIKEISTSVNSNPNKYSD